MYTSAACGAFRIPAGKPGEDSRKTVREELAHPGGLTDGFAGVHQ